MTQIEYRVIPAPRRMRKVRGVAGATELFAHTLSEAINDQAAQGWEFLRSEAMMIEEPRGWFRAGAVAEHTVLVFRRTRRAEAADPEARHVAGPEPDEERPSLLRREPHELRTAAPDDRAPTPLRPAPRLGPAQKS